MINVNIKINRILTRKKEMRNKGEREDSSLVPVQVAVQSSAGTPTVPAHTLGGREPPVQGCVRTSP